ncbi:GNAT family N-acetyltransferase [Candidatus Daviesbacteria bacterium]|nr:GNAT family N-acetyltransferase [Candidatus Daviesbacteria bacterium]
MSKIRVRKAVKSDVPNLVKLMNAQYTRKKSKKYFKWQYFNNVQKTYLSVVEVDMTIIGMFGLQIRRLTNGATVGQAIDMLIAPNYRGQGLFKFLAETTIAYSKTIDLVCVLANLVGKNACEKNLGWLTLHKIDSLNFNLDKQVFEQKNKLPIDGDISLVRFKHTNKYHHWRFEINPEYRYKKIVTKSSEYIFAKVFKDRKTDVQYGDVVDIELKSIEYDRISQLIKIAIRDFRSHRIQAVTTWALPHTLLYKVLINMGFLKVEQERYFCIKILNHRFDYLKSINNWYLVQADAEIY